MEAVEIEVSDPGSAAPGTLALPLAEDDSAPEADGALGERLRQLADDGELKGELGRTLVLHTDDGRIVVAGVGKRDEVDADAIRTAAAAVVRRLRDVGGTVGWRLDDSLPLPADEQARAVVEGAGLGGKAITFDAGGISLKPALKMYDMKGDMAGGAAVIAGTAAVAELQLPVRIVTVVAAAENLVSGTSFRPGDILRAA